MRLTQRRRRVGTDRAVNGYVVADARQFALELSRLAPRQLISAMHLGVVLDPSEQAMRVTSIWVRVLEPFGWTDAACCDCLITDHRLLLRMPSGRLASIWWAGLVGLDIQLSERSVVLDLGDQRPRQLAGHGVELIAVAAVAQAYGVHALVTHPALEPLRQAPR